MATYYYCGYVHIESKDGMYTRNFTLFGDNYTNPETANRDGEREQKAWERTARAECGKPIMVYPQWKVGRSEGVKCRRSNA